MFYVAAGIFHDLNAILKVYNHRLSYRFGPNWSLKCKVHALSIHIIAFVPPNSCRIAAVYISDRNPNDHLVASECSKIYTKGDNSNH